MVSKLEFDIIQKKNPIRKMAFDWILALVINVYWYYDNGEQFKIDPIGGVMLFLICVETYKLYRYNQFRNKKALIIDSKTLVDNLNYLVVDFFDIVEITYVIKNTSSYLLVKLKEDKIFIKNQKWYKIPILYLRKWRFKTPFVVNLERLEGETDVNFKKIESFVNENNLLAVK